MKNRPYLSSSSFLVILLIASNISFAQQPPVDATKPSQQQLDKMLRGNSSKGVWADRPYIQYFHKNGTTNYQEEGSKTSAGTWRINEAGNYCSTWPPFPRETCYELLIDDDLIYWKWEDAYYTSRVTPGNIFDQ